MKRGLPHGGVINPPLATLEGAPSMGAVLEVQVLP
jgi:hypothetical protein